jgi:hypothetical protein
LLDDVHQREASNVAGEAVAAADAAHRRDDAGARELGEHLRQMMRRHAVFLRDLGSRDVARRVRRELEHAVQREAGVLLQFHSQMLAIITRDPFRAG